MVDLQQVAQHVGVVVTFLHLGDGDLLLVRQPLQGPHGRLERGLRGLVGAGLRLLEGLGEELHHGLEALGEGGAREAPVERPGQRHLLADGVRDGGQPHRHQVTHFLVTRAEAVLQLGDAPAHSVGDRPLANQQHRDDGQRCEQAPDHHLRYVMRHQFLLDEGGMVTRDRSAS